jgi:hypothetical protein
VLFDVRSQADDHRLAPVPESVRHVRISPGARTAAPSFEYNQRGHQVYRVIEVDAQTGAARDHFQEPKTFSITTAAPPPLQADKRYRYDLADGKEIVWMSERDGWNHLYLINGATGTVKQITKGAWPVRHVIKVDEEKRQLWFSAGGMNAGEDPYFQHYYRINLDGSGLTPLTSVRANHTVEFSSDMTMFVDHYSRVDLANVAELHRASVGIDQIERATSPRSSRPVGRRLRCSSPRAATAPPTSGAWCGSRRVSIRRRSIR